VEPFHRRLAELYFKYENRFDQMKPVEQLEFHESVKRHAFWARRLSKLEALAQAAEAVKDEKWLKDICKQIDRHLSNTTGGNVL